MSVLFDKSHYELEELRSGIDDVLRCLQRFIWRRDIWLLLLGSTWQSPSHGVKEPCKTFVADVRDVFCTYILT